jgi:hypothetical protein
VVSAAERIHVSPGGFAVWDWLVVKVAQVGGHGAGGVSAAAGPNGDGFGEPCGGVAAEFGDIQEPPAAVEFLTNVKPRWGRSVGCGRTG